jgi:hypothetical protein
MLSRADFCLWAPPQPNSTIGDTEGQEVAWCTKPGHGTRIIPSEALQGVQLIKTPNYIQIAGFIDQTLVNLNADDYGGELDPHGADLVSRIRFHEKPEWGHNVILSAVTLLAVSCTQTRSPATVVTTTRINKSSIGPSMFFQFTCFPHTYSSSS